MKGHVVAVSDTPVAVVSNSEHLSGIEFCIVNAGPDQVFLGGADVTDTTGFPLTTNDDGYTQDFADGSGETLYAVCSSGNTASLNVLQTGS